MESKSEAVKNTPVVSLVGKEPLVHTAQEHKTEGKMDVSALMQLLEQKRGGAVTDTIENENHEPVISAKEQKQEAAELNAFWDECFVVTRRDIAIALAAVITLLAINNALYWWEKSPLSTHVAAFHTGVLQSQASPTKEPATDKPIDSEELYNLINKP